MNRALIFDFDGLILETEGPTYQSWVEVYQSFGYSLPFSTWTANIGTTRGDFDPNLELERLVKNTVDWEVVEPRRRIIENTLIEAQSVLPGAVQYITDARQFGLKLGLASNSPSEWVIRHLTRLGLVEYFDRICTADDVQHIKPDPELYLSVLRALEVKADEAIALEDSPIGIRAARLAGLICVAVPNPLIRQLTFSEADLQLGSLAEIPLEQLLAKINALKTQRAAS
jgi:HAD superfamily hydrolase (TIGR01509 family)